MGIGIKNLGNGFSKYRLRIPPDLQCFVSRTKRASFIILPVGNEA